MNNQFRVWDGETMHEGDTAPFCVRPDGNVYQMLLAHPTHAAGPMWQFKRRSDCEVLWCTGRKDKENNAIREGDVLEFTLGVSHRVRRVVCWGKKVSMWILRSDSSMTHELYSVRDEDPLVVGNKYQHPHLLNASPD